MTAPQRLSRRRTLGALGSATGLSFLSVDSSAAAGADQLPARKPARLRSGLHEQLLERVWATPMVDTHAHLLDEAERLQQPRHPRLRCDDWTLLLSHYLDSDLLVAGMPSEVSDRFFSPDVDPLTKWPLLEPYWNAVRHTGYGLAVRLACRDLYGVDDLSAQTVARVQAGYLETRRPGFYHDILVRRANLESCQVNCLTGEPFKESTQPTLLMQDLSIVGMFSGPAVDSYAQPAGIQVESLEDWHRVIRWWFDRYGRYATSVKSQNAYAREIDYAPVQAETAAPLFRKLRQGGQLSAADRKQVEDHLFWQAVKEATAAGLPIKLHTGYYAGENNMPLGRVAQNAASASNLCREAPEATFVFMHICYPFYEEILAVAKHYTNACLDLCWAWIINPVAAKDFLKKCLVTVPANKILPFGGDYIPVEPVLGHAILARRGIALALFELVQEGWMGRSDALDLIEPLLRGNARRLFGLEAKAAVLATAPWVRV